MPKLEGPIKKRHEQRMEKIRSLQKKMDQIVAEGRKDLKQHLRRKNNA